MAARDGDENVPDARLAEAAGDGSRLALRRIYDRYGAELYRLAVHVTGDEERAKDVVQDVFVGLPEALAAYEERGRFGGWLRTILLNRARMSLREERDDTMNLDQAPQQVSPGRRPDRAIDRETLRAALGELAPGLRTVFVLKEVEGHDHDEIADMLGLSAGASRLRLHRAKKELRAILKETGHDRA